MIGGDRNSGTPKVTSIHECTCGCGNVHRDLRYELILDPSEQGIGVRTVIGIVKKAQSKYDDWHIENPENQGYSYCGSKLSSRWAVELPKHLDTRTYRISDSPLCDNCSRPWRAAA